MISVTLYLSGHLLSDCQIYFCVQNASDSKNVVHSIYPAHDELKQYNSETIYAPRAVDSVLHFDTSAS